MINIATALQALKPNSEFTIQNNDYSTIEWHVLKGNAPTPEEVEAKIIELKLEEDAAKAALEAKKQEVLAKLGLTSDEVAALLA